MLIILLIPIPFIVRGVKNFTIIDKNESFFYYLPDISSETHNISINTVIGDVNIYYEYPPDEHAARIEFKGKISGTNLEFTHFSDYFEILWQNESDIVSFVLSFEDGIVPSEILPLIEELTIDVYLRANILYNINCSTASGNIHLSVPYGVDIQDISLNTDNGDIVFDFFKCHFRGYIRGICDIGKIEYSSTDVSFSENCSIYLSIQQGDLDFDIIQQFLIGTNVSCIIEVFDGFLDFSYRDDSPEIGAYFEIPFNTTTTYSIAQCMRPTSYEDCVTIGFCNNTLDLNMNQIHEYSNRFLFISEDIIEQNVKHYYNVTFYLVHGEFDMYLISV